MIGRERFHQGQRLPFVRYLRPTRYQILLWEFEVLKELLTHQGRILTRQNLLDKLWRYDFYGDERVVDTHIKTLLLYNSTELISISEINRSNRPPLFEKGTCSSSEINFRARSSKIMLSLQWTEVPMN